MDNSNWNTNADLPVESPRALEQKIDTIPAETALRFNALQKARTNLSKKQLAFNTLCCEILDVRLQNTWKFARLDY
jgi:hypothetical protein